ncbi:MAG: hypothetical protein D6722_01425 [Bacteroidetes bacterium]|nr:MAG: hypothetical protein D6722_01425 [Bacteroidota bacterium]
MDFGSGKTPAPFLRCVIMLHHLHPSFGRLPDRRDLTRSPQFDPAKGRFVNPVATDAMNLGRLPEVLGRQIKGGQERTPPSPWTFAEAQRERLAPTGVQVNWLGHASVLLHIEGHYYLTDPVLTERAAPFPWLGPARFFPSPIALDDMPPLQAILLSHDHYDHLDYETMLVLQGRTQDFVVPLGVDAHLRHWGVDPARIQVLDWGETATSGPLRITATPARHFSGRGMVRDQSLWASYVLDSGTHKVYFGGDSGIFPGYREIGTAHGPFDLCIMPIGAYDPAWHDIHLNPEEAVAAFQDLGGGTFLPIHWGTFNLALHSWHDPIDRLCEALAPEARLLPAPGTWVRPDDRPTGRWWTQA